MIKAIDGSETLSLTFEDVAPTGFREANAFLLQKNDTAEGLLLSSSEINGDVADNSTLLSVTRDDGSSGIEDLFSVENSTTPKVNFHNSAIEIGSLSSGTDSSQVLVRNSTTNRLEYVNSNDLVSAEDFVAPGNDTEILYNDGGNISAVPNASYEVKNAFTFGSRVELDPATIGTNSFVVGIDIESSGDYSAAFGQNSVAGGDKSFAANSGVAFGEHAFAGGNGAHAIGGASFAVGYKSYARGVNSFASGNESDSDGANSFAAGLKSVASGDGAVAMGWTAKANGNYSFVAGAFNVADGYGGGVFGTNSEASGRNSFAAGDVALATGKTSVAFGRQSVAQGDKSFAAGFVANAQGNRSVALNFNSLASGTSSFSCGSGTEAAGSGSAAMNTVTKAIGNSSFTAGYGSTATGLQSSAFGNETMSRFYGGAVFGHYNEDYLLTENEAVELLEISADDRVFSVGIGDDNEYSEPPNNDEYFDGTGRADGFYVTYRNGTYIRQGLTVEVFKTDAADDYVLTTDPNGNDTPEVETLFSVAKDTEEDAKVHKPGAGLVLVSPDGNTQARISLENDGTLLIDEI